MERKKWVKILIILLVIWGTINMTLAIGINIFGNTFKNSPNDGEVLSYQGVTQKPIGVEEIATSSDTIVDYFSGTTINTNLWTLGGPASTVTLSNGICTISTATNDVAYLFAKIGKSLANYDIIKTTIRFRSSITNPVGIRPEMHLGISDAEDMSTGNSHKLEIKDDLWGNNMQEYIIYDNGASTVDKAIIPVDNNWHTLILYTSSLEGGNYLILDGIEYKIPNYQYITTNNLYLYLRVEDTNNNDYIELNYVKMEGIKL
jgi:hypothetical protein